MEEERIALFVDFENLAIGVREALGGMEFDFEPIANALAERGRVVTRRAYADWSMFSDARQKLTRSHVELIEIPQRMGATRKNAADIKMAVDAIEVAFERDYVTTFVICTGDSDFTPLVHKLRELNKKVIGVGVKASTSALLPPACDEFLFYENLEGVEPRRARAPVEESEEVDDTDAGAGVADHHDARRPARSRWRGGARLLAEAGAPSQGLHLQRGRLRVPGLRRTAPPSRVPGRHRALRGPGSGRPDGPVPVDGHRRGAAFDLLVEVVTDLSKKSSPGRPLRV